MAPPSIVAQAAAELSGLGAVQVEEIRTAISSQNKLLASLLEHVSRWELDGSEIRLFFPSEGRTFAEILQGRDQMEKLRSITSAVLGQPLRVCVKLDSAKGTSAPPAAPAAASLASPEARARFEQDPIVRAMLERFGGKIARVRGPNDEG
jgi:hypothetical protein